MVCGSICDAMTVSAVLEQKLDSAKSIHDVQQLLSAEGIQVSSVDLVKGLIAEGASPRFQHLSEAAQSQVAQVLVLAESDAAIGQLLLTPAACTSLLPAALASHGISVDAEALAALSQPIDLDDQQLEHVVGGLDPVTAGLISLGITTFFGSLTHWVNRHYDAKKV